ncbi:GAF domain-containing protein [Vibrio lentus]|nr:GAF domain-containing protein [Vibrio lentus]
MKPAPEDISIHLADGTHFHLKLNTVSRHPKVLNLIVVIDYRSTYCEITCKSIRPICIKTIVVNMMGYATHPCLPIFGLESYIGVPIFVNDELYGTLNFKPDSYHREFKRVRH